MTNHIEIRPTDKSHLKEVVLTGNNKLIGHFVRDVDGFFYFSFNEYAHSGLFDEYVLEELSFKLKLANQLWNEHLNEYFKNNEQ